MTGIRKWIIISNSRIVLRATDVDRYKYYASSIKTVMPVGRRLGKLKIRKWEHRVNGMEMKKR